MRKYGELKSKQHKFTHRYNKIVHFEKKRIFYCKPIRTCMESIEQ